MTRYRPISGMRDLHPRIGHLFPGTRTKKAASDTTRGSPRVTIRSKPTGSEQFPRTRLR